MIYGLDIGGTKIEIAVFDQQLKHVESWRLPTPQNDYEAFLGVLSELILEADLKFGTEGFIGLGMPGLVDKNGASLSANIPAANGKDVASDLEDRIGRKVVAENDCRCFALSEANGGAAEGFRTMYGAIIGTGAAGGFTIDGKLMPCKQGIAGEYGHLPLPATLQQKYDLPLRQCGCGLIGCFEGYISGPGLLFLHTHFGGKEKDVPAIAAQWHANDPVSTQTMDCYLDILGSSFASLVMSYDPETIVLGGGVSLIKGISDTLPKAIEKHLFSGFESPAIRTAKFGDASGARGAAILAKQANE